MATTTTRRRYSPRLPREERREQVLDAALRVLAEHGFDGVSMEAVAREADIAKTVVYDAFGGRRELLQALLERERKRALAAVAAAIPGEPVGDRDPVDLLVEGLTRLLEEVRRAPDTWRLILLPADGTPPSMRDDVERSRAAILGRMEPLVTWGLGRLGLEHLDAELATYAIFAGAENAARLTLTRPRRFPPRRIAEFTGELVAALGEGGGSRSR
ncbi:MAG TPA: helix-turn-helix domain-containing protein [Thermoleophilaceae bacterium]|jgi:AcrR family transcriptional regulator